MFRPSVSVVISTYNRAESLSDTLRGVSQLDYPDYEIIVVNGPSHDSTESLLMEYGSRIKAIKCLVVVTSLPRAILELSRRVAR